MKLGTQPVNAHGPAAFTSGMPTVLPTNPNSPFAKLIVKSEVGQIVQQWLLLQNKCTLGSASSCALRCQLSGIAPYHALLVMGSRQVFIRALAPKLARNGVMVNELLLTEDQSTFEIAGHQFELIRNVKPNEPTPSNSNQPTSSKMKFTLARPMEIGQTRQPTRQSASTPSQAYTQNSSPQNTTPLPTKSFEQPQQSSHTSAEFQPQWITDLIQSAMLPLERQLNEIIEPLAAVQNELDKRSKLERKRRNRPSKRTPPELPVPELATPVRSELVHGGMDRRENEQFEKQRAAQEAAFTTQIDVQPQIAHLPEPMIVPIISPEVESQLARQNETLNNLNARLTEVKSNLGSLERVVSENFVAVIDAASAPVPTPEPVNEALQRITSVADQLKGLTNQLDEVKGNLGSLQRIVSENLASTNELRAAPEPASSEALQRLTDVANQLSVLLQDMNARQISTDESDVAWREQMRTQEGSELAWREQLRSQIVELRDTVAATESSILNATESSIERATASIEKATQAAVLSATDAAVLSATEAAVRSGTEAAVVKATEAAVVKATEILQSSPKFAERPLAAMTAESQVIDSFTPAPVTIQPPATPLASPVQVAPVATERVNLPAPVASNGFVEQSIEPLGFEPAGIESTAFGTTGFGSVGFEQAETSSFDFAANMIVDEIAEATPTPESILAIEPEVASNLFNQFAWNPAPQEESTFGTAVEPRVEQISEPEATANLTGWEIPSASSLPPSVGLTDSSANFIEETIEEVPLVEESTSSSLPSWWTDDDKTQFKDDSSASAAIASSWNASLNSPIAEPASVEWQALSGNVSQDIAEGFETPMGESGIESPSAWDVEVNYETAQSEQAVSTLGSDQPEVHQLADVTTPEPASDVELMNGVSPKSESPSSDESLELSSLLQRFGIAREPDSNVTKESTENRKPITKPLAKPVVDELQSPNTPSLDRQPEQIESIAIDQTEVVRVDHEPIEEPEPVSTLSVSTPPAETGEEESIEDYMKRLMARMRGGSVEEEPKPSSSKPVVAAAPIASQSFDSMSSSKIALPSSITERAPSSTTGPFDPEEYVPKALAPEKTRNMAAMRELANTSARSAIQVSARRRYGTAIALKLAIAFTGLGVGVTLIMINGLNVNIGLIATVASFLVALIWGFDAFSTLKPLLYAAVENREAVPVPPEVAEIPEA